MNMMRKTRVGLQACALLATLAPPAPALAHEGHDDRPAAAVSTAPADGHARFAATSDQFELVGVLDARTLTLYLDRFVDNAPVEGARLEIDLGGEKLDAQAAGDHYVAQLAARPAAGTIPVTATVVAGDVTDLLAADLVVAHIEADAHAPAQTSSARASRSTAAWWTGAAVAAALALLVRFAFQRRSRNRT